MFNITLNNNCNIINIKASTTIYLGMYINIIIIIIWHGNVKGFKLKIIKEYSILKCIHTYNYITINNDVPFG